MQQPAHARDATHPTVTPIQLPSTAAPPLANGGSTNESATPSSAATPAASAAAAASSDSSEQMWEEQLRVAAVAVAELQQLVMQRRKGAQPVQPATPHARPPDTGTLAYSALSHAQAQALTAHLLFTSHSLLHQLAQQWTVKHGRAMLPPDAPLQCHDPSPLPFPKGELCPCRSVRPVSAAGQTQGEADGDARFTPVGTPSASAPGSSIAATAATAAAPSAASAAAPTSSAPQPSSPSDVHSLPASAVRKTVLPFSNISLLEKNIVGLRTARGNQLRTQQQQQTQRADERQHFDNGHEMVHPRDIQLLQTHFTQLLTYQLHATSRYALHTPLALTHPFALLLHEFMTHWNHQLSYLRQVNSAAARPTIKPANFGAAAAAAAASSLTGNGSTVVPRGIVIDRDFLQTQLAALFTFLSSHETLIVLAYPHLHQTSLCKKVLRTALRSTVLASVFPTLMRWSEHVYAAEDAELTNKIDDMKHVSLRDIGLHFPFTLCADSLIDPAARVGEGILGEGASSILLPHTQGRRNRGGSDETDCDDVEHLRLQHSDTSVDTPVDRLIHSDEEGGEIHGESERGIMQQLPSHARRGSGSGIGIKHVDDAAWRTSSRNSAAVAVVRRNVSATGLAQQQGMSASPGRLVGQLGSFPSPQLTATSGAGLPPGSPGAAAVALPPHGSVPASPRHRGLSAATPADADTSELLFPAPLPFQPYAQSIAILGTLDAAKSVDAKLEVLVSVCRMIAQELNEFVQQQGLPVESAPTAASSAAAAATGIGGGQGVFSLCCDDLFQIFAYCLLHAQIVAPVATMNLLSECIEGSTLSGEVGYCLTTLQVAVSLLLGWSEESARQQESTRVAQAQAAAALRMPHYAAPSTPAAFGGTSFLDSPIHPSLSTSHAHSLSMASTYLSKHPPRDLGSSFASTASSSSLASGSPLNSPSKSEDRDHRRGVFGFQSGPSSPLSSSGEPTLAPTTYAHMLAANLDAFCIAADYMVADSAWQWLYEKDHVTVYRKSYDHSPIHSVKGVSLIPRPPHVVQSFLRNIHNRKHIDEIFLGGRVVQHLSPESNVVHYRFKARNWCSRQQTDMVLLHHQSVCSDGVSLITLAFSVLHPAVPPQPGYERATVRASGWLLKPVNNGTATHATYIVSPDVNGFPAWVVNIVSTKQPMLIRTLRDYLLTTTIMESSPQDSATSSAEHSRRASIATTPQHHSTPSTQSATSSESGSRKISSASSFGAAK